MAHKSMFSQGEFLLQKIDGRQSIHTSVQNVLSFKAIIGGPNSQNLLLKKWWWLDGVGKLKI